MLYLSEVLPVEPKVFSGEGITTVTGAALQKALWTDGLQW